MKRPLLRRVLVLLPLLVAVSASVAAANFREKIEELSAELVKGLPVGGALRIAVADLPDLRGTTNDFGRFVAERLSTRLAQAGRFSVIERRRLSQVLGELKFGMSDLVDPAKARRLGQMLGVEALVVGSVSDLGNQVDVDLRVIEIETNRMMFGTSATITKDQVVDNLRKAGREEAAGTSTLQAAVSGGTAKTGARVGAKRTMRFPNAVLELVDIKRSGPQLTLSVLVTNQAEKQSHFCFGIEGWNSYFVDEFGNRYVKGEVSPRDCFYAEPNVPQRVLFRFEGVSPDAAVGTLSIFNSTYSAASPQARATERNIPLPR